MEEEQEVPSLDMEVPEPTSTSKESGELSVLSLEVPFASPKDAKIAYNSLRIDKEPPRSNVTKELEVEDNVLKVKLSGTDAKNLRSAITSFMDYLCLVINVFERFKTQDTDSIKDE